LKCTASVLGDFKSFPIQDHPNTLQPFSHVPKTKKINSRLNTEIFQTQSFGNLSLDYLIGRGTYGYAILAHDAEKSYVLKVDNTKEHVEWEACVHKIVSCELFHKLSSVLIIIHS
jgi:hypothetical protein